MDRSYVERNAASRERLAQLAGTLTDAELRLPAGDGWTVGALLAHLAFWDRFVVARWEHAAREHLRLPVSLEDVHADLVNDAAMALWSALPPAEVVRLVVAAARYVDDTVAALADGAVEAARAAGRERLVDRSLHRSDHLATVEAVVAAARST